MANATTMKYGTYEFTPVPLINITRESVDVGDRANPLGYIFTMTLSGVLTPLPDDNNPSLIDVETLIEGLRTAFDISGRRLLIECDSTTVMLLYPIVKSINFGESNNNWVQTVPFTIELEYNRDELDEHPDAPSQDFIQSFNEEWTMDFIEEPQHFTWDLSALSNQDAGSDYDVTDQNNPWEVRITHTMTAKGQRSWAGTGVMGTPTNAADNAIGWLINTFAGIGYSAMDYCPQLKSSLSKHL